MLKDRPKKPCDGGDVTFRWGIIKNPLIATEEQLKVLGQVELKVGSRRFLEIRPDFTTCLLGREIGTQVRLRQAMMVWLRPRSVHQGPGSEQALLDLQPIGNFTVATGMPGAGVPDARAGEMVFLDQAGAEELRITHDCRVLRRGAQELRSPGEIVRALTRYFSAGAL